LGGKARNLTISTYESYSRTFRQFQAFLGHEDANLVTPERVVAFKDFRIAQGRSPKTVLDSDLAALRSVFDWAASNLRLPSNPAKDVKLRRAKQVRTRGKDFTRAEAVTILRHAAGYVPRGRESPKMTAAKRWVPWLCAYTGARVGEIVQLRKADVRLAGDAWVINITPEAGTQKVHMAREVVLHQHLVDLGMADFMQSSKEGYLFLIVRDDGVRGAWRTTKNRVASFAREVVSDPRVAPSHGWRHMFKTIGREVGIEDSVLDGICGHAAKTEGNKYGSVPIATQANAFAKFPRFSG
jgi:integrase